MTGWIAFAVLYAIGAIEVYNVRRDVVASRYVRLVTVSLWPCFVMLGKELPCVERKVGPEPDFEWISRPADFTEWRKVIASKEWPNPGRFEGLTNLLEAEPECWLYISW